MTTVHADFERPAIEPADIDWGRVEVATYVVHQQFRYEYPARILDLHTSSW